MKYHIECEFRNKEEFRNWMFKAAKIEPSPLKWLAVIETKYKRKKTREK